MAFDPASAGITAILGLMDMSAKGQANAIAGQGLDFQKKNAADMLRLAKAGRTDAYGNKTSFDDALNEWITQLTPEQQNLVLAGEREQRLGLTEDASRNRVAALRNYNRSQRAGDVLDREVTEYDANQPRSEGDIQNQLTRLITQAHGTGERDASRVLDRQRSRQRGNVPVITYNSNTGDNAGQDLAETMLKARTGAITEAGQRQNQRSSRLGGAVQSLGPMVAGGSSGPARLPSTAGDIAGREGQMMQNLIQAQQAGAAGVGGAYANLTKATTGPDLKGLAALYGSLSKTDKNKNPTNVGSATSFGGDEDFSDVANAMGYMF
jgi:hypothetical protein